MNRRQFPQLLVIASLLITDTAWALTENEKTFLKDAIRGGMTEIELGTVASNQATSKKVKEFGEKMRVDHTMLTSKIKEFATMQGIEEAGTIMADKEMLQKIQSTKGHDFDHVYIDEMVKDHKKDVATFEAQEKIAEDDSLKRLVSDSLPTLREHLKHAEKIQGEIKK